MSERLIPGRVAATVGSMDRFDGRSLAVGLAIGVLVGFAIMMVTDQLAWIYVFAVIGAMVGSSRNWFNKGE